MRLGLVLLFLMFSVTIMAQKDNFPESWIGTWKGELSWYKTGKAEAQKVVMTLRIAAGDSAGTYTWALKYGAAGEDNRPYILKPKDPAKAHWVIDELNGIILDQFWVGNKFCGAFTVMGNTIVNNYWIENDSMRIQFFSYAAKPIVTTGQGTEQSPSVDSYRVGSYQEAILTRQ